MVCKWGDVIMATYTDGKVAYLTAEELYPLAVHPRFLPPFVARPGTVH
jgi:hypothetical protein